MSRMHFVSSVFAVLLATLLAGTLVRAAEEPLVAARTLLLTGKYAEAEAAYQKLLADSPVPATLGIARAKAAVGERAAAIKQLEETLQVHPKFGELWGELATLQFAAGDYDAADTSVKSALAADENELAARWIKAELLRATGQLESAAKAYEWFVDYYNSTDKIDDPDDLRWIGLGAAQYARWNRAHDQFTFLVSELYPDALKLEPNYWPAHYESGLLFLEKYNQAAATKEFEAALKLNSNNAEIHAARARLALQNYDLEQAAASLKLALAIDPNLLAARQLEADIHFANFEPHKAAPLLEEARKLNDRDDETLGRLAAAYGSIDGLDKTGLDSRFGALLSEVDVRNPHAGGFYAALGDSLDTLRKYPQAAHYFQQAAKRMPQLPDATGKLGMVHMRLGDEQQARKLLAESFDADPFNVRVSNSLKVLEVLDDYETLETEHFLIRFDPEHDKITARYVAAWLEEIYPQLCQQLDYQPKEKSLFELFNKARNTEAHGWFSARMVGLPHIHTIGACAGKMVALVSPTAMDQKFNWARVLKHEFVHVINLQQTNFNIPHWFTEALAVLNEEQPRSQEWNEMLARRVPAGETFDLETINLGFIRPHSSEDWQMAYCQAEMYAEYMLERFGEKALAKMLSAYADNLTTSQAIRRSFEVDQDDFERGYDEYVRKVVASLRPADPKDKSPAADLSFAELVRAQAADPKDPDLAARLALEYLKRESNVKARQLADAALALQPKHQLASYVKARLYLSIGDVALALKLLENSLDEAAPQENALALLAALRLRSKDYQEAARLYSLGAKAEPGDAKWPKALAAVYLKSGDTAALTPVLEDLAVRDGDDLSVRKKLAQLALAAGDHKQAIHWATEAIQIEVLDVDLHRMLADALAAQEQWTRAAGQYQTALELSPDEVALRWSYAQALEKAGQKPQAVEALRALLRRQPDHAQAKQLLESLAP